ncbi:uncharacterized protein B0H18DRAFT_1101224 [Fomitopsis serialis]|uniref:uncharacterized protein n=1 Tax=Fomitopsis serialis TaxID=139415 RepID=UPI002008380B|nr:uncharacterized protein B0H18DRAFT_1101224 [Neoantrodia serialis]KAH9935469.1 hypothetical protein B0H18DRAFT_1101224 [Neoantrodia serialis]
MPLGVSQGRFANALRNASPSRSDVLVFDQASTASAIKTDLGPTADGIAGMPGFVLSGFGGENSPLISDQCPHVHRFRSLCKKLLYVVTHLPHSPHRIGHHFSSEGFRLLEIDWTPMSLSSTKRRRSFNTDSDDSDSDEDVLSANSSAQHELLKPELLGHVKYDDPSVFRRLRIYDEADADIDHCHEKYQEVQGQHLRRLRQIAGELRKAVDKEGNIHYQSVEKTPKKIEHEHEKMMYDPLTAIFTFLQKFGNDNVGALREFKFAADTAVLLPPSRSAEAYTPSVAKFRPDFNLLDKTADGPFWDTCAGFAEIKVKEEENSLPHTESSIKPAILQCADYARYHMAFRPFWIFSVTLLITGTVFRVMIVDRDGVVLSPLHSIYDDNKSRDPERQPDAKTFVRVVRALTRRLTDYQLGQDPSVTPVTRDELSGYLQESSIPASVESVIHLEGGDYYPSYRISRFGNDCGTWCTVGPPIWVSLSLLGRGTEVWRVVELYQSGGKWVLTGDIHILKSAWRNPLKLAETDVYNVIAGLKREADDADERTKSASGAAEQDKKPTFPAGIATHRCGSDVFYYEDPRTWSKITTAHLRGDVDDPNRPSKALHRIILSMVGQPLWKYTDELQLLNAFYAIVEAHQYLCEKGILHRDISAGNMLLWPGGAAAGFLYDFDMADVVRSLADHLITQEAVDPVRRSGNSRSGNLVMTQGSVRSRVDYTTSRQQGVPVTGTLQFMALELLQAVHAGIPMPHHSAHDLESIAYVLGYTVLRRLVTTPGCPESLDKVFDTHFGGMTVEAIIYERANGPQPLSWAYRHKDDQIKQFALEHMSYALNTLFRSLRRKLARFYTAQEDSQEDQYVSMSLSEYNVHEDDQHDEERITHAFFLKLLKEAIDTLHQYPSMVKKFDPELETLRPLSTAQSGSDKPSKKKARANKK